MLWQALLKLCPVKMIMSGSAQPTNSAPRAIPVLCVISSEEKALPCEDLRTMAKNELGRRRNESKRRNSQSMKAVSSLLSHPGR